MTELQVILLHEIWKVFPFTKTTVHAAFLACKSIDKTIEILEEARRKAVSPLDITKLMQK